MKLVLAPIQGLVDDVMCDLLMRIDGFDKCANELVRITCTVHPRQTWLKYAPEIANGNKALAGTSCTVQLLDSDADNMAVNVLGAVYSGADKIDLNFGCPAPTVNKYKGGAVLLKGPEFIYRTVRTLRRRLPPHIPLTVKMCLGCEDKNPALECAAVIAAAGACALTIHARTKNEGCEPPAHWEWICKIRDSVDIPVTTNGDVFTLEDYLEIKAASSFDNVMLGRGAVIRSYLARQIRQYEDGHEARDADFVEISGWISLFFDLCTVKEVNGKYPVARLKQWLGMMKKGFVEAQKLFDAVRAARDAGEVRRILSTFEEKISAG